MAEQGKLDLSITVNGKEIAVKSFKDLQTVVKDLDYQLRKGSIGSGEQQKALTQVSNAAKQANLSYKQMVDLNAQIYQVQQRTVHGFTSMSKSLHDVTQMSNRSQQGFVALSYIIQDLPYGIRGVANNITQLSQVLGTPIWLNLAISGFTSLAVVMSNSSDSAKRASRNIQDLSGDIAELSRELKDISDGQYLDYLNEQITASQLATQKALNPTTNYFEQFKSFGLWLVDNHIARGIYQIYKVFELSASGYVILINKIREAMGLPVAAATGTFDTEAIDKAIAEELRSRKKFEDELESQAKDRERRAKDRKKKEEDEWWARELDRMRRLNAVTSSPSSPFGTIGSLGQSTGAMGRMFDDRFKSGDAKSDVWRKPQSAKDWLSWQDQVAQQQFQMREKSVGEGLDQDAKFAQTVFFEPMMTGFNDLNSVIRNELFGNLDQLKEKFGTIGASIIQVLNSMIAKMIEMAIASLAVIMLSGGTFGLGDFFSVFKMIGGGKETPGSLLFGGDDEVRSTGNRMVTSGSRPQVVQIVGESKIKNDYILLSYKNAEYKRSVATA
jgi:hypothetical protein